MDPNGHLACAGRTCSKHWICIAPKLEPCLLGGFLGEPDAGGGCLGKPGANAGVQAGQRTG